MLDYVQAYESLMRNVQAYAASQGQANHYSTTAAISGLGFLALSSFEEAKAALVDQIADTYRDALLADEELKRLQLEDPFGLSGPLEMHKAACLAQYNSEIAHLYSAIEELDYPLQPIDLETELEQRFRQLDATMGYS